MDQEEQRTAAGRRRRSSTEIVELMQAYEASGLSRVEFCQREGLSLATLARYRKRRRESQGEQRNPGAWVRVEVAQAEVSPASMLAVVLATGRRIEVSRGFDAETLRRVVELLERA